MYLIAALGNPGKKYQHTRHNIGFLTIQVLARRHGISIDKKKFEGQYGVGEILKEKVILLTPLTYMNLSGLAVGAFLRYFRISFKQLIVIHDDLDLSWTGLRIADKRGAAGHKGVLSIIEDIKTTEFTRVRMGIGRPREGLPPEAYVLEPFSNEEQEQLPALLERACEAVEAIISQGPTLAMNGFNTRKASPPTSHAD
ncbi:MAG: aminoacyl-tRNA hydrolase [Thermodesulfobacteriota bacterium]